MDYLQQIQPQSLIYNPNYIQPTLKQLQPPQQNTHHIYEAKKSGMVNEIINTINKQHQKVLQRVSITEEQINKFNYFNDLLIKKCDMMNNLEERYKKHYR
eukprot:64694_1